MVTEQTCGFGAICVFQAKRVPQEYGAISLCSWCHSNMINFTTSIVTEKKKINSSDTGKWHVAFHN